MPIVVNTNVASINAQRNLNKITSSLSKSLERLSSGLRINKAGDDAAGLAIATGMQAQIRGLTQATRNANDGLSLIGTAEGAIGTVTDILQRVRELAVQAANDLNSGQARTAIQQEIDAQVGELSRIATSTEFNGTALMDGSFTSKNIQVGANENQSLSVTMADFRSTALGKRATVTSTNVIDVSAATGAAIDGAGNLVINGVTIGSSANLDTVSTVNANYSAIAKAAAINAASASTSVTASVVATTVTGSAAVIGGTTVAADIFSINGVTIWSGAGTAFAGNDADAKVRTLINAKSGLTGVVATLDGANKLVLTASDGRNVTTQVTGAISAAATGIAAGAAVTTGAKITLDSTADMVVKTTGANPNLIGTGAAAQNTYTADASKALEYLDVTTAAGAAQAILSIDAALGQVSTSRAQLGAITNRLENTISNLQTTIENLSASHSRIMDADFAVETANMTRAQILQQAGTAVLSQANVTSQAALSLLGR